MRAGSRRARIRPARSPSRRRMVGTALVARRSASTWIASARTDQSGCETSGSSRSSVATSFCAPTQTTASRTISASGRAQQRRHLRRRHAPHALQHLERGEHDQRLVSHRGLDPAERGLPRGDVRASARRAGRSNGSPRRARARPRRPPAGEDRRSRRGASMRRARRPPRSGRAGIRPPARAEAALPPSRDRDARARPPRRGEPADSGP